MQGRPLKAQEVALATSFTLLEADESGLKFWAQVQLCFFWAQITGSFPVLPLVPGGFPETSEIIQICITGFIPLLSLHFLNTRKKTEPY